MSSSLLPELLAQPILCTVRSSTIYPILTRLGIDLLVGRITHLRDDDRFKAVGPDAIVLSYPSQGIANSEGEREAEIWFDWAFVDFWKSNYCARFLLRAC